MLRPASLTMPIVGFANKLMGLYERDELVLMKTTLEESASLFQLASVFGVVTWLLEADGMKVRLAEQAEADGLFRISEDP